MDFDIDLYIFSLPDNSDVINVSNKNLTYIPSLSRFTNLKKLDCRNNNLTSLPELPDCLSVLLISNNPNLVLNAIPQNINCLNCELLNESEILNDVADPPEVV
jgi:Leucine-rich repeat (LRR) protein